MVLVMNKNVLKISSITVIIVIFLMTVGYSVLVQRLNIIGNAKLDTVQYSIVIKSITDSSNSNGAYQNSNPTFNATEGTMYSILPNLDSSIIYNIKIKNVGRTSGILDYTFVSINNNKVKYKIGGINNGDIIAAGETVDITIEFEYWDDVKDIDSTSVSSIINFEFVPYSESYSTECTSLWDGTSSTKPSIRKIYGVDYYQISNASEFNWFVNEVNNTANNINAILTKNICLNSKSIEQIGTNDYTGTFDGQNRLINGFYLNNSVNLEKDTKSYYSGLFRKNSGYIKNLNLEGSLFKGLTLIPGTGADFEAYDYVGGIVTENLGKISNSSYLGEIKTDFTLRTNCFINRPTLHAYVGGISAINKGVITGSYNKAVLSAISTNRKNACNYKAYLKLFFGGLTAQNIGYISDSYNNNTLTTTGSIATTRCISYFRIGGLVGDFTEGSIKNSYNSGNLSYNIIVDEGAIEEEMIGGAIGNSAGSLTNVYYLNNCGYNGEGISVNTSDLKSMNISIGNYYFVDSKKINDGYPILKWQK